MVGYRRRDGWVAELMAKYERARSVWQRDNWTLPHSSRLKNTSLANDQRKPHLDRAWWNMIHEFSRVDENSRVVWTCEQWWETPTGQITKCTVFWQHHRRLGYFSTCQRYIDKSCNHSKFNRRPKSVHLNTKLFARRASETVWQTLELSSSNNKQLLSPAHIFPTH